MKNCTFRSFQSKTTLIRVSSSEHFLIENQVLKEFMDWIKILTYATHLFSYSFNIILLYVVAKNSKGNSLFYLMHLPTVRYWKFD